MVISSRWSAVVFLSNSQFSTHLYVFINVHYEYLHSAQAHMDYVHQKHTFKNFKGWAFGTLITLWMFLL